MEANHIAKAKHNKAARWIELFNGLQSFQELEQKIANLDHQTEMGEAFEVFAEAYLVTQRPDVCEVWPTPGKTLGPSVLEGLNIPVKDNGVDGVYDDYLRRKNAYQVKFHLGRPILGWEEVGTFFGLISNAVKSGAIDQTVIFTNCDEVAKVINQRKGFFCITGNDLDRLEPDDFQAIYTWLKGSIIPVVKKQPLAHQQKALQALTSSLASEDRASCIMACATGKTLVGLWLAEDAINNQNAKRILVLFPSLSLLRQTLHEWQRQTTISPFLYQCVCSDETVKDNSRDNIITAQSDLDFPVTTESKKIRRFLRAKTRATKIIFSTYQSIRRVEEADPNYHWDLAIFDEAHRTAGPDKYNWSFAVKAENMPISKRVFFTATPRHYNPRLGRTPNHDIQPEALFSMDNPLMYGRHVHTLSFRKAIERGLICRYKVLVPVIATADLTDRQISQSVVVLNGEPIRARQVAGQQALISAIQNYGVKKIFTFHSRVKAAESFTRRNEEGIGYHLPEFCCNSVNGEMKTKVRDAILAEFGRAEYGIVSNARCLTEGIDCPEVDMVAFLSPKKSRIDIIQAVGRALRKPRDTKKEIGYILIPAYVHIAEGETIQQAIERADLGELWNVLNALQEVDEALVDILRRRALPVSQTRGYDESRRQDLIEFIAPEVGLEALRDAVETFCLDRLAERAMGDPEPFPVGTRFGRLTVIEGIRERPTGREQHVQCECGNEKWYTRWHLANGMRTSCGCSQNRYRPLVRGQRFEKLVITGQTKMDKSSTRLYEVQCDCGGTNWYKANSLRIGRRKSCGKCRMLEPLPAGHRFGHLVTTGNHRTGHRLFQAECICDCGHVGWFPVHYLQIDERKSCGKCLSHFCAERERHGLLTATTEKKEGENGRQLQGFQCDCGRFTWARPNHVKQGRKRSCGCLRSRPGQDSQG